MHRSVIIGLVLLPATAAFALSVVMLVSDYGLLVEATERFTRLASNPSTGAPAMIAASTGQDMHRINVFADGTWALLSAIWFTLGLIAWPKRVA
ncbi:MAG: hypothetical protein HZB16_01630 [Armatimonadetes bacterium]|nr:hypothetical protein [Armatimonadota bacterium]